MSSGTGSGRIESMIGAVKDRANRLGDLRHHEPRPLRLPERYLAGPVPPDLPVISVVTPTLDRAAFLETTMRSVLDQRYPALEYVVQDGGSRDGTQALLERNSAGLAGWFSEPDDGQAQALNRGFAHTSGEVMAYLNSDDLLLPGSLAYVARYLQRHQSVDVVYGHRILIDADGLEIGRQVIPRHDDEVLSWADFVPQETMFWRRRAWDAAGGRFDESYASAMDWDLLVRMRDSGARMARLPRFLGAFRVHGEQKTLREGGTTGVAEIARIRERLHGRPVPQQEALREVRSYLLRHVALDRLYRWGLLRY